MGATPGDKARPGSRVGLRRESAPDRRVAFSELGQAKSLNVIATSYDGQPRGEGEARALLAALGPYAFAFDDVKEAIVEHYRRTRWRVGPSDIIQIVQEGAESGYED